jgi:bifunctional NMN adenylyltransferase/nudix hydrolase
MQNSEQKIAPVAAVIGRWQLPHNGHMALLRVALEQAERVIVVIGSALQGRSQSNPFTWAERRAMIKSALTEQEQARVSFVWVRDYANDKRWVDAVTAAVQAEAGTSDVLLVGHEKDSTSYYLRHFPRWGVYLVPQKFEELDATTLRDVYFGSTCLDSALTLLQDSVPEGVVRYLQAWGQLPYREQLRLERVAISESRLKFNDVNNVAADAVVQVHSTKGRFVLLVKRKGPIGRGQWAIPGGFVENTETTFQGALRELREETGMDLWSVQAQECLKDKELFDNPKRSGRSRIISAAYFLDLGSHTVLPAVFPRDETEEARWVNVEQELPRMLENIFEDHALILERFLGSFAGEV